MACWSRAKLCRSWRRGNLQRLAEDFGPREEVRKLEGGPPRARGMLFGRDGARMTLTTLVGRGAEALVRGDAGCCDTGSTVLATVVGGPVKLAEA